MSVTPESFTKQLAKLDHDDHKGIAQLVVNAMAHFAEKHDIAMSELSLKLDVLNAQPAKPKAGVKKSNARLPVIKPPGGRLYDRAPTKSMLNRVIATLLSRGESSDADWVSKYVNKSTWDADRKEYITDDIQKVLDTLSDPDRIFSEATYRGGYIWSKMSADEKAKFTEDLPQWYKAHAAKFTNKKEETKEEKVDKPKTEKKSRAKPKKPIDSDEDKKKKSKAKPKKVSDDSGDESEEKPTKGKGKKIDTDESDGAPDSD